jgi:hypothetical protein
MSPSTNGHNGVHHATDEAIDLLYSWMPGMQAAPPPCPEAAFSCTVEGKLDGHRTLLTVRGQSAAEFKRNLAEVRGLLDPPQTPVQASSPGEGWCSLHKLQMRWNEGKEGRKGWYSHRVDDGAWCKGK